jgi:Fe(3+) dicitrate transport protein
VNYILRNGSDINKPFEFETQQTIGSNGLFNTYNAIGGNTEKVHYYGFFDHRNGDGWRQNSRYFTNAGFGTVTYRISPKFSLTAELMHSHIRSQQPGGLTDSMFHVDAQQSLRSRNWFDIVWTTPALIANYNFSDKARLNTKLFGVIGDRNSVGFMQAITVKDSINAATRDYNNRVVQIDKYRNYGLESRFLTDYSLGKMNNTFSGGVRLYTGTTYRNADGKGSTGSDYNVNVIGNWPKDIEYTSQNAAVFVENIFRLSEKLLVVPGIRYEYLQAEASGRNGYKATGEEILLQNQKRSRSFLLAGIGAEYHLTEGTEFYANFTQAYRPMQFADLTTPPTTDIVDPNLDDAKGYNIDLGYRGKVKDFLQFDVSGFYLQYNNRIGVIVQQRQDSTFYNYRTNVGNSTSKGFEGFVEFNPVKAFSSSATKMDLSVFASYGYTNAEYGNLKVITKSGNNLVENNLKNKKVENAPGHIIRAGISAGYKGFLLTGQVSHVSEAFSDANNTVTPTANGQNGLIPSYTVTDLTASYKFTKNLNIKAGINNLFDELYFTRRAGGYPGPGVLPADGRTFFVSFGAKL